MDSDDAADAGRDCAAHVVFLCFLDFIGLEVGGVGGIEREDDAAGHDGERCVGGICAGTGLGDVHRCRKRGELGIR